MPKELKIILRETPVGLEPTPKQSAQRERFAKAAREATKELQGTKLRGAAKIQEFNRRVGEKIRSQGPE